MMEEAYACPVCGKRLYVNLNSSCRHTKEEEEAASLRIKRDIEPRERSQGGG